MFSVEKSPQDFDSAGASGWQGRGDGFDRSWSFQLGLGYRILGGIVAPDLIEPVRIPQ